MRVEGWQLPVAAVGNRELLEVLLGRFAEAFVLHTHLGDLYASIAVRLAGSDSMSSKAPRPPVPVTQEVLQALQQVLPARELLAGRLVCKQWADHLASQVSVARLEPCMWQHSGQQQQLQRLLRAFPCLHSVHLIPDPAHAFDLAALALAVRLLVTEARSLWGLHASGLANAADWHVLLLALQPLAPQLRRLAFADIALPPNDGLRCLSAFMGLTSLTVTTPYVNKLQAGHLAAVACLTRLQRLRLSFRAAEGTVHAPLALDALARLTATTALELEYTGLRELAHDVAFYRERSLMHLTRLVELTIRLVPLSCLRALPLLPSLRVLTLHQLDTLTGQQCGVLARCTQLCELRVDPMPWEHVACLGELAGLQALSLTLGHTARSSVARDAGCQVMALTALAGLQRLELAGRFRLCRSQVVDLTLAWPDLTRLQLCCELQDGNAGFEALTRLRHLRLQPYKWDAWSSEPPILLCPALLPPSLTCFEGLDVWCLDQSRVGGSRAGPSSDSLDDEAAAAAHAADAGVLALPLLQRLVLKSVSPVERALRLPALSQLQRLESLELSHSQLSHEHIGHIVAHLSATLTALKLAAVGDGRCIKSSALAQLAKLPKLSELHLAVYEKALDRHVRGALVTMRQLRALTICTCSRNPAQTAKLLQCLTALTSLTSLRVGVGYGALEALKKLGASVTAAVPDCQFEIETDV